MSNLVYTYRKVEIEGVAYLMPCELDPVKDLDGRTQPLRDARAYRAERREAWAMWQRLGLPLPDPDTGRVNLSSIHPRQPVLSSGACIEKRSAA